MKTKDQKRREAIERRRKNVESMEQLWKEDTERLGKTIHRSNTPEGQAEMENIKTWIELWERKIATAKNDIENTIRNLGR